MAIFYPDLSHFDLDRGVTVEPGTVAVIAKATHGTLFLDRGYATLRAQAAAVGAVFGAYHWLNHGDGAAQADYYYSQVGATPCMVDAEDMPGNSGFNGYLTVGDIVEFVTALRAKGGICNLCYLPPWYWEQHMGSPDLTPLARLGVGLVSSNYTTYADDGPGWMPYGDMVPTCWQYTDALPYGGSTSDFNAFRGTVDEFRALITGDDMDLNEFMTTPVDAGLGDKPMSLGLRIGAAQGNAYEAKVGVQALQTEVAGLTAKVEAMQAPAAPTQDQVDAAVLKALSDPGVQAGIGKALAAHLHVS